jgi:nuclear pore complex protein Nup205
LQLAYYKAKLALLLTVSQTRFGAHAIINAGLFQSIKASGLFSTDPDLGAGMFLIRYSQSNTNL